MKKYNITNGKHQRFNIKSAVPVIITDLINGTVNTSTSRVTEDATSQMVVMRSTAVVPHFGCTFKFNLPSGILAKVYYGSTEGRTDTITNVSKHVSGNISDGGTFTFPCDLTPANIDTLRDSVCYFYRIGFTGNSLTAQSVMSMIDNGQIAVTYEGPQLDAIERNMQAIGMVDSVRQNIVNPYNESTETMRFNQVVIHVSDTHSDMLRCNNAMDIADHLKADAMLMTGDFVTQCFYDGITWPFELAKKHNTPQIVCAGNHDGVGKTNYAIPELYGPFAQEYGYSQSKMYYYKDIADAKLRIIAVDCSDGSYSSHVSDTQLKYIAASLLSTPAGYGVIIALHQSPTDSLTQSSQTNYPKFWSGNEHSEYITTGGSTIVSMVDAFIAGSSISVAGTTYNYANKNTGAEFLFYACGHNHADNVGYLSAASQKQLKCQIGSDNIDFGKGFTCEYISKGLGNTKSQDLINAYVIDRVDKTVTVIRFGCDYTSHSEPRDIMRIPYAD